MVAGSAAALLHAAGGLKSTPLGGALPFDVTAAAFALLLLALPPLLAARRWWLMPGLALPLAACGALWLWWVMASVWSPWAAGAADRLPEVALMGPAMLLAGLAIGGCDRARRAFCAALLAAGAFTGAGIAWGLANDALVLGGEVGADPERVRVSYQVAGLVIACAAGIAGVRLTQARGLAVLPWAVVTTALAGAVLLPGGRAAFAALAAVLALAPALLLWREGRSAAGTLWLLAAPLLAGGAVLLLLADDDRAFRLATLERLLRDAGDGPEARALLWGAAWRLGGWWGLGVGGYPPAAGFGSDRGMRPHNHAIEALVEGGALGLALWCAAFGGAALLVLRRLPRVAPRRGAEVVVLVLPVALTVMVSTDLGNRMAWMALGLALSLAVEAEDV
jgi:O-antigen ligase